MLAITSKSALVSESPDPKAIIVGLTSMVVTSVKNAAAPYPVTPEAVNVIADPSVVSALVSILVNDTLDISLLTSISLKAVRLTIDVASLSAGAITTAEPKPTTPGAVIVVSIPIILA